MSKMSVEEILARGFARALQFRPVKVKEPTGISLSDVPDLCLAAAFRCLHSQDDRLAVALTCRRWRGLESLSRSSLRFVHQHGDPSNEAGFLHDRLMHALRSFPHILSITIIRYTHLTDSFFELFKTRCFSQLTNLHLQFCLDITDKTVDYLIAGCPALTHLSVKLCVLISDVGLHAIARAYPHLELLDISYCNTVTDAGIDDVLKSCPNMQDIAFSYCFEIDGWGLRTGKNLKKVEAEACRLTDAGLVEGFQGAKSIQVFNMADLRSCEHLGATGLGQLAVNAKMVQVLCLRMCSVLENATVKKIAQGCVNLKVWDLSGSGEISLEGWEAVALYCAKLQFLDVHRSMHFCDRSMLAIRESCPSLRVIHVTKCPSLTPESCFGFQISRPNVRVDMRGSLTNCCHIY